MRASTPSAGDLGGPSDAQGVHSSPESVFREILHSSGLYALIPVGQRLVGVVLLPVYTRCLTPTDYGTIELVVQTMFVLGTLLGGAYSAALGYHYFERTSAEWRKTVAGTCILGSALIGVAALALGWGLSVPLSAYLFHNPTFVLYFRILFVTMLVDFLLEGLMQWLRVENRAAVLVIASLSRIGLTVVCTLLLLVVFRMGVAGVFWSNLIGVSVTTAPLAVYALRLLGLRFNARLFWRMLRFSLPLAMTGLALLMVNFGDRFFLQHYRTYAEVGLYSLAYKLGMLISVVYLAFHTYWSVQVYQILRRKDGDIVFARVFTYVMITMSWCALGLIFLAGPALRVLTTPAFQSAAVVVPMVVAAYFCKTIGDFFRCLFLVENRPGSDTIINWLGAAVCLAAYVVLIPRFGSWGAAGATLITFFVIAVVAIAWTWRLRRYFVENVRLAKIGLAAGFLAWCFFVLPVPVGLVAQIGWAVLLLVSFPVILVLLRVPTRKEYSYARSALRTGGRTLWQPDRADV